VCVNSWKHLMAAEWPIEITWLADCSNTGSNQVSFLHTPVPYMYYIIYNIYYMIYVLYMYIYYIRVCVCIIYT
jgi:hypothetical protein